MKLITLNTWGGRIKSPLLDFIKKYKDEIDVFCFQEVYHNPDKKEWTMAFNDVHFELFNEIGSILNSHIGYFCPTIDDYYGIATFIKNDLDLKSSGDITIFDNPNYSGEGGDHSRKALWNILNLKDNDCLILNVHGLWNGKGKTDTPDRIKQSNIIKNFINSIKGPKIICGDFNLLPNTKSLDILSRDMQDLIKINKVTSTRTSFYTRAETSGKFADYVFVSPDIEVLDFKVLPEEVSDHSALFTEIDL